MSLPYLLSIVSALFAVYCLSTETTPTATSSAKTAVTPQPTTAQEPGPPGSYPGTQPAEHRTQPANENQPPPPPAYESVATELLPVPEVR